jgi:hypothetical protein
MVISLQKLAPGQRWVKNFPEFLLVGAWTFLFPSVLTWHPQNPRPYFKLQALGSPFILLTMPKHSGFHSKLTSTWKFWTCFAAV